jgi:hypothetical protein
MLSSSTDAVLRDDHAVLQDEAVAERREIDGRERDPARFSW